MANLSFIVIDTKTGNEANIGEIAQNEDWAKGLMYCDMEGFAINQDGNLILLDECGNFAYCPPDRFDIKFESGQLVEMPCKVGDTLYFVYSKDQEEPSEVIVKDISAKIIDGELCWFAFNEWGYGGRVGEIKDIDWWYLGADKLKAQAKLEELQQNN